MDSGAKLWIGLVLPLLAGCRVPSREAEGEADGEVEEEGESPANALLAGLPQARSRAGGRAPTVLRSSDSGVAGLDVPISPSTDRSLSENSIAVHPADPRILLCGNNAASLPSNTSRDVHVGWSTDGGRTWTNLMHGPAGRQSFCDPAVAIDRAGRFFVGYNTSDRGQGVALSTDLGATWRHVQVARAPAGGALDKPHLAVDTSPASPFEGRAYLSWTRAGSPLDGQGNVTIHCSRSEDHGSTWSAPALLSPTTGHQTGSNLAVGPDGEVYCSWSSFAGMAGDERAIVFNRSLDGGVTWETSRRPLANLRGIHGTNIPNLGLRVYSFPSLAVDRSEGPRRGWLYVLWVNIGQPRVNSGDADVFAWRSMDRGTTWDGPVRVNDDLTSNAQWQVWATCDDANGDLYAVFYDRREDPADREARAYVARSTDGGETWVNFPVGDAPFLPAGIYGTYMGDYIGIAALDSHVYPLWGGWGASPTAYVSPFVVGTDQVPPVITCPADLELECTGSGGVPASHPDAVAFLAGASATDETDPEPVLTSDAPAFFPLGTTRVTFTATDDAGNRSECAADVSVVDGSPPALEVSLDLDELWPPDHRLVQITVRATAADGCDPEAGFVLASITSSEPDEGLESGDLAGDVQQAEVGTSDTRFLLRAERAGKGAGRTYTIVYTASDRSGNSVVRELTVRVAHDRSR
jgi:hypothetical protein